MTDRVCLLSIPGLREKDLLTMPRLSALMAGGDRAPLAASFPAVTCSVQANMTTGVPPEAHGVIANGFYWRDMQQCEMWTAWNEVVQQPQIWDRMHAADPKLTSLVWFPMLAKGCGADFICTPAPIHNPDGSESLWCYTKPEALYGELRDALEHFPLQNFWGPMSSIKSTAWIVSSALKCTAEQRPRFSYLYLPHLDYAGQRFGPDSPEAVAATQALDNELGRLFDGVSQSLDDGPLLWLVASEYAIVPVNHVTYPNRALRGAGLLSVQTDDEVRETIDFAHSKAWAMVDHQHSHVFVKDHDPTIIDAVAKLFDNYEGIAEVLAAEGKTNYEIAHQRSGDIVLVSEASSWQAYYWWEDDEKAPPFARKVDIHQKPGYDPVEMFFDPSTKGIPLDATLVKGSHGAPVRTESQRGVMLSSQRGVFVERTLADIDVAEMVLRQFGL